MSQSTPSLAAAHLFAVDGLVAVVTGGATGTFSMLHSQRLLHYAHNVPPNLYSIL
jgi:hypothetical protein